MVDKSPKREISDVFVEQLKSGVLLPFLDRVRHDDTLSLEIRNGYVDLYYRGGRLLGIKSNAEATKFSAEFDKHYFDGAKGYRPEPPSLPRGSIEREANAQEWVDAFAAIKQAMDIRFSENTKIEKEYQQAVVRDNNRHSTGELFDYVVIDVEYVQSAYAIPGQRTETGYRFDMVGFRWPVAGGSRANSKVTPVIMEMKAGDGAITSSRKGEKPDDLSPGLVKHVLDFERFLTPEPGEKISKPFDLLRQELAAMFETKKRLKLPSLPKRMTERVTITKDDVSERPEVLFVLANHQPSSKRLKNELEELAKRELPLREHADYSVATVSFAGYALFADKVIPLDEFIAKLP
jgi:hypothetical protein